MRELVGVQCNMNSFYKGRFDYKKRESVKNEGDMGGGVGEVRTKKKSFLDKEIVLMLLVWKSPMFIK